MGTAEPSGIPAALGGTGGAAGGTTAEAGEAAAEPGGTAAPGGGTVERLSGTGMFGDELKAQRLKRRWTQLELARKLNYSNSYISDLERGAKSPTLDLAGRCDTLFDLPGTFVRMYTIVKRAEEFPAWFESIVVPFEVRATRINGWELGTVPGLLQTEDYARAFIQVSRPDLTDVEIDRLVAVRIGRQDIFAGPIPPKVWYAIDESAFRRRFGGAEVMAAQVDRLMAVASVPGNVIQVLPFVASEAIGASGPIVVYEFKSQSMVGYAECYQGGRLVQDAEESGEMLTKLNLIRMHALAPRDSVAWLRTLRSKLADD